MTDRPETLDRPDTYGSAGTSLRPEFASTLRGYDRFQVDDFIDRLYDLAQDAEERARAAESELEFSRHATVGPRVSQILDLAVAEAKELQQRVAAEADQQRQDARAECEGLLARARESAAQINQEAERERAATIADGEARRSAMLAEVERLSESKTRLLGDLGRLQELLAEATGIAPEARDDDEAPAARRGRVEREATEAAEAAEDAELVREGEPVDDAELVGEGEPVGDVEHVERHAGA